MSDAKKDDLVALTAQVVAAYVGKNSVAAHDLPGLIGEIHGALRRAADGTEIESSPELKPAVPVKKSVLPDYIICLEEERSSSR